MDLLQGENTRLSGNICQRSSARRVFQTDCVGLTEAQRLRDDSSCSGGSMRSTLVRWTHVSLLQRRPERFELSLQRFRVYLIFLRVGVHPEGRERLEL